MKRDLFRQMLKEWRDNVWLIIELAVVCVAIWILVAILYLYTQGLFRPRGFEPENVYSIELNQVPKESADYIDMPDAEDYFSDFRELLRRLRENENVESVACHMGALPYNFNYYGQDVSVIGVADSITYYGNRRSASPDIVNVLGFRSLTGATQQQLADMLRRGEILLSSNEAYESQGRDPMALKGKRVMVGRDSTHVYRVGDIIENVRRNDYEMSWGGTIIMPISEDKEPWGGVALRVKPGRGDKFVEDFKNDPSLRKLRNVYLADVKSLMDIREGNQRNIDVDIRLYSVLIVFLLVTVFLGLLGTFWFRMQQRVGEIAIRKVCGARRSQIFRRILSEGMILLAVAVAVASACIWPFTDAELLSMVTWKEMLFMECAAVALIAAGIVLSLWWPARKAMNVEPAIAVKDE